jgi:hypothetical protein
MRDILYDIKDMKVLIPALGSKLVDRDVKFSRVGLGRDGKDCYFMHAAPYISLPLSNWKVALNGRSR